MIHTIIKNVRQIKINPVYKRFSVIIPQNGPFELTLNVN